MPKKYISQENLQTFKEELDSSYATKEMVEEKQDSLEFNPTVPAGITPNPLSVLKSDEDYYEIKNFDKLNVIIISRAGAFSLDGYTFSDEEYATLCQNKPCIIYSYNTSNNESMVYYKDYVMNGGSIRIISGTTVGGSSTEVVKWEYYISASTKKASVSEIALVSPSSSNPASTISGELKSLKVGHGTWPYKVLNSEQFHPAYDDTATYEIGDIISYKGKFYICLSAISTAEAWTAAHWLETTPGIQIVSVPEINDGAYGTITDEQYAKLCSKNSVLLFGHYVMQQHYNNASGTGELYFDQLNSISTTIYGMQFVNYRVSINKWTTPKRYTFSSRAEYINANPTLTGNESSLTALQIGTNKYKLAASISPETLASLYDNTATYSVGDYVIYNNVLYVCNTAVSTAEDFDSNKWSEIKVTNQIKDGFEIVDYQTSTALTDEQIIKAQNGRLAIWWPANQALLFLYSSSSTTLTFRSNTAYMQGVASPSSATNYVNMRVYYKTSINLTTKKITALSPNWDRDETGVSNSTLNVLGLNETPVANDHKLVVAQNLRKTQDMICQDYYDATATYNVGDIVIYQNNLYKCNTAISTAESWTAAHWTQTSIKDLMPDVMFIKRNASNWTDAWTADMLAEAARSRLIIMVPELSLNYSSDLRNVYYGVYGTGSTGEFLLYATEPKIDKVGDMVVSGHKKFYGINKETGAVRASNFDSRNYYHPLVFGGDATAAGGSGSTSINLSSWTIFHSKMLAYGYLENYPEYQFSYMINLNKVNTDGEQIFKKVIPELTDPVTIRFYKNSDGYLDWDDGAGNRTIHIISYIKIM